MVTINGTLCKVKLLKNQGDKLVVRSPEMAGVGGSTPSLATIILKNLDDSPRDPSVRSQSAGTRVKRLMPYVYDLEEAILICIPTQSALSPFLSVAWLRIAVSIFPAATMRSRLTAWV